MTFIPVSADLVLLCQVTIYHHASFCDHVTTLLLAWDPGFIASRLDQTTPHLCLEMVVWDINLDEHGAFNSWMRDVSEESLHPDQHFTACDWAWRARDRFFEIRNVNNCAVKCNKVLSTCLLDLGHFHVSCQFYQIKLDILKMWDAEEEF